MGMTQSIIQAPAAGWTPICQYRKGRKSLIVQCPQTIVNVASIGTAVLNDGNPHQILAANALRRRVSFWKATLAAATTGFNVAPSSGPAGGWGGNAGIAGTTYAYDTYDSAMAGVAWSMTAGGPGLDGEPITMVTETYANKAIILGVQQNTDLYVGPYGITPVGLWTSDDLSSGGSTFRLSAADDGELVEQEWFVWPVGTTQVSIPVLESFETPELDAARYIDPEASFTVKLPRLSRAGCKALNELLGKVSIQDDDDDGVIRVPPETWGS